MIINCKSAINCYKIFFLATQFKKCNISKTDFRGWFRMGNKFWLVRSFGSKDFVKNIQWLNKYGKLTLFRQSRSRWDEFLGSALSKGSNLHHAAHHKFNDLFGITTKYLYVGKFFEKKLHAPNAWRKGKYFPMKLTSWNVAEFANTLTTLLHKFKRLVEVFAKSANCQIVVSI